MGAKKQPKPPPAPDPRQIAQTDVEFNRIDQVTPFGSLTFSGPNRNQANLSLSPELQQLFGQQVGNDLAVGGLTQQAVPGLSSLVSQPFSAQGLPSLNIPNAPSLPDYNAFRGDVERAYFDRSRGLLDEQFGREEDRLRQTLANQGLQSGGEAFGAPTRTSPKTLFSTVGRKHLAPWPISSASPDYRTSSPSSSYRTPRGFAVSCSVNRVQLDRGTSTSSRRFSACRRRPGFLGCRTSSLRLKPGSGTLTH
jgi:hypothetical protein